MKVDFIWKILGTQCGSHLEFPAQQEPKEYWNSESYDLDLFFGLRKLWCGDVASWGDV
jgi:hypothetical protein